jgi:type VI protein secretion system component VasK
MDGQGAQLCRTAGAVLRDFPFQAQGGDAELREVNDFLHPDGGALWAFLDEVQSSGLELSAEFRRFVDRARVVSNALYGHGGSDPRLRFRLRGQPNDQVPTITLNVDGDEERFERNDTRWGNFTWESANAGEVTLRAQVGDQTEDLVHRGTWALFKFFQQAAWQASGSYWRLSWTLDDSGARIQADLDLAGADPILRRGFFDGFSCPRSFVR